MSVRKRKKREKGRNFRRKMKERKLIGMKIEEREGRERERKAKVREKKAKKEITISMRGKDRRDWERRSEKGRERQWKMMK